MNVVTSKQNKALVKNIDQVFFFFFCCLQDLDG